MRLLIDECLSTHLVITANEAGFEAYHVAHRGWGGKTDREIVELLIQHELVLVTNNRDDFLDLVRDIEIHPGLIVIIPNVRREGQIDLFKKALAEAAKQRSMINAVVEVDRDGEVTIREIPRA